MTHAHRKTRRPRALLGAGTAVGLAFAMLPLAPAGAAIDTSEACPDSIPEDGFTDTGPEGSELEEVIDCLAAYGVTSGTTPTTYGSVNLVTRGQLATFVLGILDDVDGFTRPADAPDAFDDDDGSEHEPNINDAAALGLITGFEDGTFRPVAPVSRGQMATFLVSTLAEAGVTVSGTAPDAFDDDDGTTHEDNIDVLARLDVVDGDVAGNYNPAQNVRRDTMARFLTRTIAVLVDAGLYDAYAPPAISLLAVAPQTAASLTTTGDNPDASAGDDRTYTVTGLVDTQAYRVTLVTAANVTMGADGRASFVQDGNTGFAAAGTVAADITLVNGSPADTGTSNGQSAGGVMPVDGTITFVVDGGGVTESVVPVAYTDQGGDVTRLNVDASGDPEEPYGVGGRIDYAAAVNPPPDDTTAPTFTNAVATGGTSTLTVTYSEALDCGTVQAGDYDALDQNGTTVYSPTGASCSGAEVVLTFPGTPFTDQAGMLRHNGDVTDVAGNPQSVDDEVGFATTPAPVA